MFYEREGENGKIYKIFYDTLNDCKKYEQK
jgi:hypothetical protein